MSLSKLKLDLYKKNPNWKIQGVNLAPNGLEVLINVAYNRGRKDAERKAKLSNAFAEYIGDILDQTKK